METTMETTRKHFSQLGWMYFLGTLIVFGVQAASVYGLRALAPELAENTTVSFLVAMIPMYALGMPLMVLLIRRVPAEGKIPPCKMTGKQWLVTFAIGYAGMYLANLLGTLVTMILGIVKGSMVSNNLLQIVTSNHIWANIIVVGILAPIIEEYVFRKLLIDRTIKYGEGIAVLTSALMFALFHGNLNQFAYAFVLGAVFAFVYVKTGDIRYTIAMHMLINFMGSVLTLVLFQISGLEDWVNLISSGNVDYMTMMDGLFQNMGGLLIFDLYALGLMALVIIGIVMFVRYKKRICLVPTAYSVPKGMRLRTYFLNVGMMLFILFWLVQIVLQIVM